MHPGRADTPGVETSLPRFYRLARPPPQDAAQGADTIVWLGAADETARSTGRFWHDRARATHLLPCTRETCQERERLWARCAQRAAGRSTPPPQTRRNTMARGVPSND